MPRDIAEMFVTEMPQLSVITATAERSKEPVVAKLIEILRCSYLQRCVRCEVSYLQNCVRWSALRNVDVAQFSQGHQSQVPTFPLVKEQKLETVLVNNVSPRSRLQDSSYIAWYWIARMLHQSGLNQRFTLQLGWLKLYVFFIFSTYYCTILWYYIYRYMKNQRWLHQQHESLWHQQRDYLSSDVAYLFHVPLI